MMDAIHIAAMFLFIYMMTVIVALAIGVITVEYVVPYILRKIDQRISRRGGHSHGRN